MLIRSIELYEIKMPLVHFFETSFGRTYDRQMVLVRVTDVDGNEGWGEITCGETPGYSEEWVGSAGLTAEKILAPMVVGNEVSGASEIWDLMKQARGNRMAKAGIETACWDLEAKQLGVPLWQHLGGVNREIECGVSIGIQDNVEQLFEKIQKELDAGYQRIKIKIAPHWDDDIIEKVREKFGGIRLMGDANSAYTLNDIELFKKMDRFDLMMFEQPLPHDDIVDHAKLQSEVETPICLDESIRSADDARKAIELGSCKIINLKLGRVGGHSQAKLVEKTARESGIGLWCGGMLETGIGRAHNIAMSTLAGFNLPGDVSASKRYWHQDVIVPQVEVNENGIITASDEPGIGFNVDIGRVESRCLRKAKIEKMPG